MPQILEIELAKEVRAMSELNGNQDIATEGHPEGDERSSRSYGRRALMLGATAGAGAAVTLLAGTDKAYAANNGDVILGVSNAASATTEVTTTEGDGLRGSTSQTGQNGVEGNDT